MTVRLVIPGPPRSGERAGSTPEGVRYSQRNTRAIQHEVGQLWVFAGRPYIDGPVAVRIVAYFPRPAGHFLPGGGLSAHGRRHPFPDTTPEDFDNLAKPVVDGLARRAFGNDRRVCDAHISKRWDDGRGPRTVVWISPMIVEAAA